MCYCHSPFFRNSRSTIIYHLFYSFCALFEHAAKQHVRDVVVLQSPPYIIFAYGSPSSLRFAFLLCFFLTSPRPFAVLSPQSAKLPLIPPLSLSERKMLLLALHRPVACRSRRARTSGHDRVKAAKRRPPLPTKQPWQLSLNSSRIRCSRSALMRSWNCVASWLHG